MRDRYVTVVFNIAGAVHYAIRIIKSALAREIAKYIETSGGTVTKKDVALRDSFIPDKKLW